MVFPSHSHFLNQAATNHCPFYEDENYLVRKLEALDASDLLSVYSDEKAVPLFNSDNCNGDVRSGGANY